MTNNDARPRRRFIRDGSLRHQTRKVGRPDDPDGILQSSDNPHRFPSRFLPGRPRVEGQKKIIAIGAQIHDTLTIQCCERPVGGWRQVDSINMRPVIRGRDPDICIAAELCGEEFRRAILIAVGPGTVDTCERGKAQCPRLHHGHQVYDDDA